jgi:hypothetical protein
VTLRCENCKHARKRVPGVMVPNNLISPAISHWVYRVECSLLKLYRVKADFHCASFEPSVATHSYTPDL